MRGGGGGGGGGARRSIYNIFDIAVFNCFIVLVSTLLLPWQLRMKD